MVMPKSFEVPPLTAGSWPELQLYAIRYATPTISEAFNWAWVVKFYCLVQKWNPWQHIMHWKKLEPISPSCRCDAISILPIVWQMCVDELNPLHPPSRHILHPFLFEGQSALLPTCFKGQTADFACSGSIKKTARQIWYWQTSPKNVNSIEEGGGGITNLFFWCSTRLPVAKCCLLVIVHKTYSRIHHSFCTLLHTTLFC